MDITTEQADKYQGLFNYLNDQYGLNLTINGMNDLIVEVDKAKQLILPIVSKSFTAKQIVDLLENEETLDDAILFFKEKE